MMIADILRDYKNIRLYSKVHPSRLFGSWIDPRWTHTWKLYNRSLSLCLIVLILGMLTN